MPRVEIQVCLVIIHMEVGMEHQFIVIINLVIVGKIINLVRVLMV